jgi:hypothetical protein
MISFIFTTVHDHDIYDSPKEILFNIISVLNKRLTSGSQKQENCKGKESNPTSTQQSLVLFLHHVDKIKDTSEYNLK